MEKNSIKISEIFSGIQGEGKYVGVPTIFIRLAGCNLNCSFCDTPQGFGGEKLSYHTARMRVRIAISEVLKGCKVRKQGLRTLTITGGEPGVQNEQMYEMFSDNGFLDFLTSSGVSIIILETNGYNAGKYWDKFGELLITHGIRLVISFSPKKETSVNGFMFKPEWLKNPNFDLYIKILIFTVNASKNLLYILKLLAMTKNYYPSITDDDIYLQPVDNDLKFIRHLVKFGCYGYRLSVQIHKILGLK